VAGSSCTPRIARQSEHLFHAFEHQGLSEARRRLRMSGHRQALGQGALDGPAARDA